ncbi:unnamed protein product [Heligmosomoides polygyrus]|uniref:Uncharacterized protein n=1 Tax=Heligmosomoides polygyrus TaxID=6339 RepID=A0A183FTL7_HELPZ|nr:unnamed protein product [Heligmosomoides polygyrus]
METKMLRWTAGVTNMNGIKNDAIRQKFGVPPIADKSAKLACDVLSPVCKNASQQFPAAITLARSSRDAIWNRMRTFSGKVQCRSRDHHDATTTVNEPRSVNRVVASLIRSIEDSRYAAPDRPAQLTVDNPGQDAATQTSPFSISRSSSFDWINEPTEGGLRNLQTPLGTPR